jgi:olfactory receptor
LLVVMAYDCYVAICKPFHYMKIISYRLSYAGVWCLVEDIMHSKIQIFITIPLLFCAPNVIDHYFCDLQPLFKFVCTDTIREGIIVCTNNGLVSTLLLLILVSSYVINLST